MKSTVLSSNASSWLKGCNNSTAEQKGWIPKWIMCVHSRIQIKTLRHGQKWIMAPQWRKDRCSASRMSTTMWRLLAVCHVVANTPRGRSWRTSGEFSSQISIKREISMYFYDVRFFNIYILYSTGASLPLFSTCSGIMRPGMNAIMGPTGSGKSRWVWLS